MFPIWRVKARWVLIEILLALDIIVSTTGRSQLAFQPPHSPPHFPHNLPMDIDIDSTSPSRDTLPLRLATAAVGIPLLALCVWLGGIPLLAITAAAAFLGIWELRVLLHQFGRVLWPLSALIAAAFLYSGHTADMPPTLIALTAIAGGSLGAVLFTYRTGSWDGARSWTTTIGASIYPAALLATGLALRESTDGLAWLTYAILGTFASDTAAYATGRLIGRHKLSPSMSPGKTWEGAAGAVIGAAAISAAFAVIVQLDGLPLINAILLGAGLSILGQMGDLAESWLKRQAGSKDSGQLLPGHGGILDRLDSLLPILPAVFLYVTVITTME